MPDDGDIVKMYRDGKSAREIGELLGVSHVTILKRLASNGVKRRPRVSNPGFNRKFDYEEAKRLYVKEGLSRADIASRMGIDISTINKALKGMDVKARHWVEWPESDMVRWYKEGQTLRQIAAKLGKPAGSVRLVLIRRGVKMRGAGRRRLA